MRDRVAGSTQKVGARLPDFPQLVLTSREHLPKADGTCHAVRNKGDFSRALTIIMKNALENFLASVIVGTFVFSFAYVGSVAAQTAVAPPGGNAAIAPPGGSLPAQPHSSSTANSALSATPSSGVVNQPSAATAPAATQNNTIQPVNPQTGAPQYTTPNANSPQNATPASGQAPTQSATTNSAGQPMSQ